MLKINQNVALLMLSNKIFVYMNSITVDALRSLNRLSE